MALRALPAGPRGARSCGCSRRTPPSARPRPTRCSRRSNASTPTQQSASHSDSTNVLDRLALGVFVGRERELERLREAFDDAVAGRGGLVMLVGEPGIGKTRTTQELETYAKMRGAQVLWGRTHESAGAPPYWPWIQAGDQRLLATRTTCRRSSARQMTPEAINELVRIFPWLRDRSSNVAEPPPGDLRSGGRAVPAVRRLHAVPAARSRRRRRSSSRSTTCTGPTSRRCCCCSTSRASSRARACSIVGNYRDTDITARARSRRRSPSLNRESGFDRIVLRGLSRDEVARLHQGARATSSRASDVLDRIFEETEGNAFFLSEVVNLMAQEGTLTEGVDLRHRDPGRRARGARPPPQPPRPRRRTNCCRSPRSSAATSPTTRLTLLGDRDDDALLKLDRGGARGARASRRRSGGRYRFTHAQMQETLLAEL